jgi:hypothetical protein
MLLAYPPIYRICILIFKWGEWSREFKVQGLKFKEYRNSTFDLPRITYHVLRITYHVKRTTFFLPVVLCHPET